MQIGCRFKVHRIKGRDYVYFWHYEADGGHRRQIQEYIGPAASATSRSEAVRRMAAYYDRCLGEIQRRRALLGRTLRT